MTPEAQRIAIAESCGWTRIPTASGDGIYSKDGILGYGIATLPDYLNDLNAMHEAENILTAIQWNRYIAILHHVVGRYKNESFRIHATAPQRAEAFLVTLGKWTENP